MEEKKAKYTDVMFEPGIGYDPVSKWVKKLIIFYAKHGFRVQSHDFRVTAATELYKQDKDLVKLQKHLNHSSVKVTQRYVKVSQREV